MERKKGKDCKGKKPCKAKKVIEPEKTPEIIEPQVLSDSDREEEAVLSTASVVAYAEAIGISDISQDIAASLAEDATYRLREVIHNCAVLMKNSKHSKLYVDDLNSVLETYESPPLYGYSSFPELKYLHLKLGDDNGIFVPETETVNLVSLATSNNRFYQNKDPTVKGSWILPEVSEVVNEVDINSDEEAMEASPPLTSDIKFGSFVLKNDDKILTRNELRLLPQAQKYCLHLAKTIIRGHEPNLKIILTDVRSNPRVSAVSPYLLNFVTLAINMLDRRASLTYALLRVVEALVQNPYVNPSYSHSVKRVVNALLVIAIEPEVMTDCDDLLLRKRASLLLKKVFQSWLVEVKHQNDIIKILDGILLSNISLCSHYGALILLTVLGYCAKSFFFFSILKKYLPNLSKIEEKMKGSLNQAKVSKEINHIKGALLLAAESMYRQDLNCNCSEDEWKCRQKIDEVLYLYFGDSLCLRRLCSRLVSNCSNSSVFPSTKNHYDREDILFKKGKKSDSNQSEFTFFKNAVTRSSKMLAKRYKPVSTFLQKRQISRHKVDLKPELVFDSYRLLDPFRSVIYFNFIGSTQIPNERLKRKKLFISYPPYDPSKSKHHCFRIGKETKKIKFCTSLHKKSCVGDLYVCI